MGWREFAAALVLVSLVGALGAYALICAIANDEYNHLCSAELRQIWLSCEMYANENNSLYPPIQSVDCEDGLRGYNGSIDSEVLIESGGINAALFLCPRNPLSRDPIVVFDGRNGGAIDGTVQSCEITEWPRIYSAWAIAGTAQFDEAAVSDLRVEMERFSGILVSDVDARSRDWPINSPSLRDALTSAGATTPGLIPRMQHGVGRFFTTDVTNPEALATAEAGIPVVWDATLPPYASNGDWHGKPGTMVLYADGHAAFVESKTDFPLNAGGRAVYEAVIPSGRRVQ